MNATSLTCTVLHFAMSFKTWRKSRKSWTRPKRTSMCENAWTHLVGRIYDTRGEKLLAARLAGIASGLIRAVNDWASHLHLLRWWIRGCNMDVVTFLSIITDCKVHHKVRFRCHGKELRAIQVCDRMKSFSPVFLPTDGVVILAFFPGGVFKGCFRRPILAVSS